MFTHVVSFSGGRTSAYLVYLMEQKRKTLGWDVRYVFMDTGAEHELTYKFIKDLVRHWGIPLRCIKAKVPPTLGEGITYEEVPVEEIGPDLTVWKELLAKYGAPSVNANKCTDRLKVTPCKKWIEENIVGPFIVKWVGIRCDEPNRLTKKKGTKYLADISDMEKEDILAWWKEQPFDLEIPEWLGNCVFCPKKSNLKLAMAERDDPLSYKKFCKALNSPCVRTKGVTLRTSAMYRGMNSLEGVIAMFKGSSREEIYSRLRGSKAADTGSCSESCEAIL